MKNATPIRRITFEPGKTGGMTSKTDYRRQPGKPYEDSYDQQPDIHPTVEDAAAHLIKTAGPSKKAKPAAKKATRMGSQAAAIGNKMLSQGQGDNGAC